MLESGVSGEDGVVRLDDGGGDLRSGVDGKLKLRLLAVVDRESLHKEGGEARAGTTTEGVEDEEALKTSALIGELADSVEDEIDDLLADGVVSSGIVVGGVFLACDQLLRVEELSVGAGSDLINDGWLEINEDGSGDVLSSAGLGEEGVERIVTSADGLVRGHLSIGLDSMLEAVKLPAGITHLDTTLADMNGDNFSHDLNFVLLRN